MPSITALMIDSREPEWVKSLKFGGIPTMVTMLETGDVQAVTDDGCTLIVERKTPQDFLNTLRDERLFPQLARMVEMRNATTWPYLVITGYFGVNREGKIITDRGVTGWTLPKVEGALLTARDIGILVTYCNGQPDYEDCILRLGRRSRTPLTILPARPAQMLGPKAAFLAGLPGIGIERVQEILDWSNHKPAHALLGLTDMDINSPIGLPVRKRIRDLMGLADCENLMIYGTNFVEPVKGEQGKDYE